MKEDSIMTSVIPIIAQDWPPPWSSSRRHLNDVEESLRTVDMVALQLPAATTTVEISPLSDKENCNKNISNVLSPITSGKNRQRKRRLSIGVSQKLEPDELTVERLHCPQQIELLPVFMSPIVCSPSTSQPSFSSLPNLFHQPDNSRTHWSRGISRSSIVTPMISASEDSHQVDHFPINGDKVSGMTPSIAGAIENCSVSDDVRTELEPSDTASMSHSQLAVNDVDPDTETASVTHQRHRSHSVDNRCRERGIALCRRRSSFGNEII